MAGMNGSMLKQIKTKQRVKEHGEVFTNEKEVKEMCDLVPAEIWQNIDSTFLEPSCGTGNFLVEILKRKLIYCHKNTDILRAYKSIYGIDILKDNIEECKTRLLSLNTNEEIKEDISKILNNNMICGDFLTKLDTYGNKIKFLEGD